MEVQEDLEDVKDAKERADNKRQVAKLQVGLLVSVIVVVGIFIFKNFHKKNPATGRGSELTGAMVSAGSPAGHGRNK